MGARNTNECHCQDLYPFDCTCQWVKDNPGTMVYCCVWHGMYKADVPVCKECEAWVDEDTIPVPPNNQPKEKETEDIHSEGEFEAMCEDAHVELEEAFSAADQDHEMELAYEDDLKVDTAIALEFERTRLHFITNLDKKDEGFVVGAAREHKEHSIVVYYPMVGYEFPATINNNLCGVFSRNEHPGDLTKFWATYDTLKKEAQNRVKCLDCAKCSDCHMRTRFADDSVGCIHFVPKE